MNRIESRHDPRNPNSGKVMAKCGMKYEGLMRQADYNNKGICDYVMYGMTADEYKELTMIHAAGFIVRAVIGKTATGAATALKQTAIRFMVNALWQYAVRIEGLSIVGNARKHPAIY